MGIAIPGKTVFLIETAPCFSNEKIILPLYYLRSPILLYYVLNILVLKYTKDFRIAYLTEQKSLIIPFEMGFIDMQQKRILLFWMLLDQ